MDLIISCVSFILLHLCFASRPQCMPIHIVFYSNRNFESALMKIFFCFEIYRADDAGQLQTLLEQQSQSIQRLEARLQVAEAKITSQGERCSYFKAAVHGQCKQFECLHSKPINRSE